MKCDGVSTYCTLSLCCIDSCIYTFGAIYGVAKETTFAPAHIYVGMVQTTFFHCPEKGVLGDRYT